MKKNYLCPHCRAVLNPNVKIIFVVAREGRRGLMLLNARPGDYGLIVGDDFQLNDGEFVDFHCPVCDVDLVSGSSRHFAEIVMSEGKAEEVKVEFSRIYGEHATFIVDGRDVTSFGENAHDFDDINFFGH